MSKRLAGRRWFEAMGRRHEALDLPFKPYRALIATWPVWAKRAYLKGRNDQPRNELKIPAFCAMCKTAIGGASHDYEAVFLFVSCEHESILGPYHLECAKIKASQLEEEHVCQLTTTANAHAAKTSTSALSGSTQSPTRTA